MNIRPLIFPTPHNLEDIQQKWEPVISDWFKGWFSVTLDVTLASEAITLDSLFKADTSHFYRASGEKEKFCILSVSRSAAPGLLSYIIPTQISDQEIEKSNLLKSFEERLWQDLATHVIGADSVEVSSEAFKSSIEQYVAGAGQPLIRVKVSIGGFYFFLILPISGDALPTTTVIRNSEIINKREDSLGKQKISLYVMLAKTELVLSELGKIREGDVIRLDHPLNAPLYVSSEGAGMQLKAFLCRKGEELSVAVDSISEEVMS